MAVKERICIVVKNKETGEVIHEIPSKIIRDGLNALVEKEPRM
jgi:uncharacterized FlaG/YvyC family protein